MLRHFRWAQFSINITHIRPSCLGVWIILTYHTWSGYTAGSLNVLRKHREKGRDIWSFGVKNGVEISAWRCFRWSLPLWQAWAGMVGCAPWSNCMVEAIGRGARSISRKPSSSDRVWVQAEAAAPPARARPGTKSWGQKTRLKTRPS